MLVDALLKTVYTKRIYSITL